MKKGNWLRTDIWFTILIVILIYLSLCYYNKLVKQQKKYIITLGKANQVATGQYGTPIFKVKFTYKGSDYSGSIVTNKLKNDDIVFVTLLPENPNIGEILVDQYVNSCFYGINTPPLGWLEIPTDCDSSHWKLATQ